MRVCVRERRGDEANDETRERPPCLYRASPLRSFVVVVSLLLLRCLLAPCCSLVLLLSLEYLSSFLVCLCITSL